MVVVQGVNAREGVMFQSSCHCGGTTLQTKTFPETITCCNCSMCNRIGALWAYYQAEQVTIKSNRPLNSYLWGKKLRTYHSCSVCGCVTHYTQKRNDDTNRVAINTRMAFPKLSRVIKIRYFDGANTFKYIT